MSPSDREYHIREMRRTRAREEALAHLAERIRRQEAYENAIQTRDYTTLSTVTGWAAGYTAEIYYKLIGNLVIVWFNITGTSDAVSASFTLPAGLTSSMLGTVESLIRAQDNGGAMQHGMARVAAAANTIVLYPDLAASAWTAANAKAAVGMLTYES